MSRRKPRLYRPRALEKPAARVTPLIVVAARSPLGPGPAAKISKKATPEPDSLLFSFRRLLSLSRVVREITSELEPNSPTGDGAAHPSLLSTADTETSDAFPSKQNDTGRRQRPLDVRDP